MDCGPLTMEKKIWNWCHVHVVQQQQFVKRVPLKLIGILIAGLQLQCAPAVAVAVATAHAAIQFENLIVIIAFCGQKWNSAGIRQR